MQSGTLGERQTNKSPTFVHVTPRALCHASGNLVFYLHNDFAEKQGLPAVYYPKKWKETYRKPT